MNKIEFNYIYVEKTRRDEAEKIILFANNTLFMY